MRLLARWEVGGAPREGKIVEADETYIGKRETPATLSRGRIPTPTKSGKAGGAQKRAAIGLVERCGRSRTVHINPAISIAP